MRLQVFHRTHYIYRISVTDSYNEVRLRPVTQDKSRLEFFLLNVQPPVRLQHFRDNYLNYVHYFDLVEPHRELVIEAQSTVNTTSPYAGGLPVGVDLGALRDLQDDMMPVFLNASRYVEDSPELWKLGLDISNGCTDIFTIAEKIRSHIYQNWTYAPNTTSASTHVREVLESKSGVCQDYAHLMIGICRAIGIPARYVSGYLFSGDDGSLRGVQASHAWCEIFVPGRGWYGLDPTNDTLADERHIKIATGRDYHDAAPVSGHFDGPPGATTSLKVDLRIEELPP
jgi:transglutaminase-like putative cysteine protease